MQKQSIKEELESIEDNANVGKTLVLNFGNSNGLTSVITLTPDNYSNLSELLSKVEMELGSREYSLDSFQGDSYVTTDFLVSDEGTIDKQFIDLYFEDGNLQDKIQFLQENCFVVALDNVKKVNVYENTNLEGGNFFEFVEFVFDKVNGAAYKALTDAGIEAYFDIDTWVNDLCQSGKLIYSECQSGDFLYEINMDAIEEVEDTQIGDAE